MSRSLPTRISLQPKVIFQKVNQEAVLLDMSSEQYYALNELGLRLWELVSEDENLDLAITRLLDEYDVDEDDLRRDILAWIDEMHSYGLVIIEEDEV